MKHTPLTPVSEVDLPERLNLASYLLDARVAEGRGGRTAIRTADGALTFAAVKALSEQYARLLARDDIRPQERVVVALPDTPDFVGVLFGILRRGSVAVMVNPDAPEDLLQYFFEYTGATAVFVPAARVDVFHGVAAGCARSPRIYGVGGGVRGRVGVGGGVGDVGGDAGPGDPSSLAASAGSVACFDTHRDDAAIWLFTGGTTGRPKAVVQSHRSFANTTQLYGQRVLGLHEDDITIAVPKLYFGYATGSNLFFPFSVGASCVLFPERCTPDTLFAEIRRHQPTVLIGVPTMVQQMVAHETAASQDLSCLRLATSAGEALPVDLHDRWTRAFNVELLDGLGTAEMWHIFISNRPGDVVPGTLGRAVPGFELRLCDDDGTDVADGDVGLLRVRGESRAIGYWQQMEASARAFQGEWYVSGDMLRRQPDGTYVYCGRADDMLKVAGKWLAPSELEHCLLAHPAVREVAVVGVRNAEGLVKPHAFVVAEAPSQALGAELQAFAKARLESYKYPREVVFLDVLPRTHLGKVDRGALARGRRI